MRRRRMACPNCGNEYVDVVEEIYNEDYHHELYECPLCGTIFKWESHRTVEVEATDESEFNKELKQAQELKKIQESQIQDEEEYEDEDNEDGQ
jgi:uncharacterized Zn finger protein